MEKHSKRLRAAVVIGADTSELEQLFDKKLPELPIKILTGAPMAEVVAAAIEFAQRGDTVLLAPAAASMDQYRDYADRGLAFQAEVRKRFGL
jgi:UDP-N-acetylmuramoylalanine--D-glutamate ligase